MEGRAQKGWKGPLYLSRPHATVGRKVARAWGVSGGSGGSSGSGAFLRRLSCRNAEIDFEKSRWVGKENKEGDQVWGLLSDSAPSLHLHREIHNATDRERQGECDPTYKIGLHIGTGEITIGVQSR